MKTAKEWISQIIDEGPMFHDCICCCERCKRGREVFLLESDIEKIQQDAIASYEIRKAFPTEKK